MARKRLDSKAALERLFRLLPGGLVDDLGHPVHLSLDLVLEALHRARLRPGPMSQVLLEAASRIQPGAPLAEFEETLCDCLKEMKGERFKWSGLAGQLAHPFGDIRSDFDDRLKGVIDASGEPKPFEVAKISSTLHEVGLSLPEILTVLEELKPLLTPGMKTSDIQRLIYELLGKANVAWAQRFEERYGRGLRLEYPDGTKHSLNVPRLVSVLREAFDAGMATKGRKLVIANTTVNQLARTLLERYRAEAGPVVKTEQIAQAALAELEFHWGRTLGDLTIDPSQPVLKAQEELQPLEDLPPAERAVKLHGCVGILEHAVQAILVIYGYLPGKGPAQTFGRLMGLVDAALADKDSDLARDTREYLLAKRAGWTHLLESIKGACRVLQTLCTGGRPSEAQLVNTIWALQRILEVVISGRSLDPGDPSLSPDILRCVFRHRYSDLTALSRKLQVLPERIISGLRWLSRAGYILAREMRRDVIVELSEEGQNYCHDMLGLRFGPVECPACSGHGIGPPPQVLAVVEREMEKLTHLPRQDLLMGQFFFSPKGVAAIVSLMLLRGDVENRRIACLSAPLVAVGLTALKAGRRVTALDLDEQVLECVARESGVEVVTYDIREEVPDELRGQYECFFIDPFYDVDYYRLSISRALQLLRPKAACTGYVVIPPRHVAFVREGSHQTPVGSVVVRLLVESGFNIVELWPGLAEYSVSKHDAIAHRRHYSEYPSLRYEEPWRCSDVVRVETTELARPLVRGAGSLPVPYEIGSRVGRDLTFVSLHGRAEQQGRCDLCGECYRQATSAGRASGWSQVYVRPQFVNTGLTLETLKKQRVPVPTATDPCMAFFHIATENVYVLQGPTARRIYEYLQPEALAHPQPPERSRLVQGVRNALSEFQELPEDLDALYQEGVGFAEELIRQGLLAWEDVAEET